MIDMFRILGCELIVSVFLQLILQILQGLSVFDFICLNSVVTFKDS